MAVTVETLFAVLLVSTLINCVAAISDTGAIAVLSIIIVIFLIVCVVLLVAFILVCLHTSGRAIPFLSWCFRSKSGCYDLEQSNTNRSSGEFSTSSIRLQLRRKPSMTPEMSPVNPEAPVSFDNLPEIRVSDVSTSCPVVVETNLDEKSENSRSAAPEKNSIAEDDNIFVDGEVECDQSTVNCYSSKLRYPAMRIDTPDDQPLRDTASPVGVDRLVSISSTTMGPTSPIPSPLPAISEDIKELDFTISSVEESSVLQQSTFDSSHTTEPPPSYQSHTLPHFSTLSKSEDISSQTKPLSSSHDNLFSSLSGSLVTEFLNSSKVDPSQP